MKLCRPVGGHAVELSKMGVAGRDQCPGCRSADALGRDASVLPLMVHASYNPLQGAGSQLANLKRDARLVSCASDSLIMS
jgi:hypothetical protein